MKKEDTTVLSCLGLLIYTIAVLIAANLFNGWVVVQLWTWFIVRQFSLPAISIPEGIGVALIASLLTHQLQNGKDERITEEDSIAVKLLKGAWFSVAPSLVIFVMAWFVQMFITTGVK